MGDSVRYGSKKDFAASGKAVLHGVERAKTALKR